MGLGLRPLLPFGLLLLATSSLALAQGALPEVVISKPAPAKKKLRPLRRKPPVDIARIRERTVVKAGTERPHSAAPRESAAAAGGADRGLGVGGAGTGAGGAGGGVGSGSGMGAGGGTAGSGPVTAAAATEATFQRSEQRIETKVGANSYDIGRAAIQELPGGANTPIEKVLLRAPGVAQDSAASGDYHVRNEHANVQYRIDGITIPDGVSGFGQLLETSFVGRLSLITGALPAEFGLHTAGIVDIQSRTGAFDGGGSVSLYGGSRGTITPSLEYGGQAGPWDYFFTGRFLTDQIGIENPAPTSDALHDLTRQGRYFGYATTKLDDVTRLSILSGGSIQGFQIPDNPGQMPQFAAFGVDAFDSSKLNENQLERNLYNVVAVQRSVGNIDTQLAYFSRYSDLRFSPDPIGDLLFNGVASNVYRSSFLNGLQGDAAYAFNNAHTLRLGFITDVERTRVSSASTLLPTDADGNPLDAPFESFDGSSKYGYLAGVYAQDEWKMNRELTLNTGLRFDQIFQYTDANQLSPRASLQYQPFESTVFHAGYARYFTPPEQALAAPTNLAAVAGTTQQPGVPLDGPVKPERSNYFDVGVTRKVLPNLEVGIDGYYKIARDLLDDGQFGQAYVLSAFNYERGENEGVEVKANYDVGDFRAYGNVALAQQKATQVISNQFLFDPDELAYISNHYVYTDHTQIVTASAGVSYLFYGTRYNVDMIYGSGLRSGFANLETVPQYVQFNAGLTHDFVGINGKPLTARFDVINLLDKTYELRDGSGIGVFAPQYGPRRGYFAGLSQRF